MSRAPYELSGRATVREMKEGPSSFPAAAATGKTGRAVRILSRSNVKLPNWSIGRRRISEWLGASDPSILADAARSLAYFGEDIGTMIALVDRALALNLNYARGWHISGARRLWAGQPESPSNISKPRSASAPAPE